ncbi:MAG: PEP-CTERM sorting domain-containing protein [Pseudomonadaceae bacterium]|nr:PEP-CTERM sorting domain-containing protein [Pseudomonadaceae bacterium]
MQAPLIAVTAAVLLVGTAAQASIIVKADKTFTETSLSYDTFDGRTITTTERRDTTIFDGYSATTKNFRYYVPEDEEWYRGGNGSQVFGAGAYVELMSESELFINPAPQEPIGELADAPLGVPHAPTTASTNLMFKATTDGLLDVGFTDFDNGLGEMSLKLIDLTSRSVVLDLGVSGESFNPFTTLANLHAGHNYRLRASTFDLNTGDDEVSLNFQFQDLDRNPVFVDVPEPSTLALFGVALAGLFLRKRIA